MSQARLPGIGFISGAISGIGRISGATSGIGLISGAISGWTSGFLVLSVMDILPKRLWLMAHNKI